MLFAAVVALCATPAFAFSKYNMLCLVNTARREHGLRNLGLISSLCTSATEQCSYQADHQIMTHVGKGRSDPGQRMSAAGFTSWTTAAENVAYGYSSDEGVMKAWMNSPGHRANILSKSNSYFGYGVQYDNAGIAYFTQDFAGNGHKYDFPTCPGRGEENESGYGSGQGYNSGGYGGNYGRDNNSYGSGSSGSNYGSDNSYGSGSGSSYDSGSGYGSGSGYSSGSGYGSSSGYGSGSGSSYDGSYDN